ncbi:MAG: hypothetical protein NZN45_09135 [Rhodovarius sp.]|nr:hypothetical protein [Rhodovarius sp.]
MRLLEDTLRNGGKLSVPADRVYRVLHVVHGSVGVAGQEYRDGTAWHGRGPQTIEAGRHGAAIWRFEIAPMGDPIIPAEGGRTLEKLATPIDLPEGDLLLRHDSVAFPPGGCAFLHRHPGPGIRCLLEGGIRIDTAGHSVSYAPGGAWFEPGPEPVFAQAADRPTRFVRVMVLPRRLLGTSSIQYLREEDRSKPKSQIYQGFIDVPLTL